MIGKKLLLAIARKTDATQKHHGGVLIDNDGAVYVVMNCHIDANMTHWIRDDASRNAAVWFIDSDGRPTHKWSPVGTNDPIVWDHAYVIDPLTSTTKWPW